MKTYKVEIIYDEAFPANVTAMLAHVRAQPICLSKDRILNGPCQIGPSLVHHVQCHHNFFEPGAKNLFSLWPGRSRSKYIVGPSQINRYIYIYINGIKEGRN